MVELEIYALGEPIGTLISREAKLLLGSQATEVLTRAKVPVLICR
jgi:nucleotide-binding universal stress UspA family protein